VKQVARAAGASASQPISAETFGGKTARPNIAPWDIGNFLASAKSVEPVLYSEVR
jgi:hypothetical protein